ncbi:MAG: hypothetical protein LBM98_03405, partial [Oscillospiraceae bacterium]|nr:hypothetical protein [Oscillospiraceae bacterium]
NPPGAPGAQNQAPNPHILFLHTRHGLPARLYVLRIASAVALAKTAHGAGKQDVRRRAQDAPPVQPHVSDI